jgi:hypothetical protein
MARGHPNILVHILDGVLRGRGFNRRKKTWHLAKPDTILVVDLWKSPASRDYIIDLGVLIRQLSPTLTPGANVCHISHRLSSLVAEYNEEAARSKRGPKSPVVQPMAELLPPKFHMGEPILVEAPVAPGPHIYKALDLDDESVSNADRTATITADLIKHGLPFLDAWDSLGKIRAMLCDRENRFARSTFPWAVVYTMFGMPTLSASGQGNGIKPFPA